MKHRDRRGVPDGDSVLVFKSYDQGRELFQGTEQDLIWLDEEANESIRSECILRLMTTDGMLIETFTPLRGLTPIVLQYLPDGDATADTSGIYQNKGKAMVMAGWDDVPHLTAAQKALMLAETEPHLKDARSKGIPSLGAGAIYLIPETDILVDDFPIPRHWRRLQRHGRRLEPYGRRVGSMGPGHRHDLPLRRALPRPGRAVHPRRGDPRQRPHPRRD